MRPLVFTSLQVRKFKFEFQRGIFSFIYIIFVMIIIPDKSSSRVTAVVHGIIEDIDVPFPIPNAEACFDNHSGVVCPLPAGTGTSYHATLPVLAKYPTVIFSSARLFWKS